MRFDAKKDRSPDEPESDVPLDRADVEAIVHSILEALEIEPHHLTRDHLAWIIRSYRSEERRTKTRRFALVFVRKIWQIIAFMTTKGLPAAGVLFFVFLAWREGGVAGVVALFRPS